MSSVMSSAAHQGGGGGGKGGAQQGAKTLDLEHAHAVTLLRQRAQQLQSAKEHLERLDASVSGAEARGRNNLSDDEFDDLMRQTDEAEELRGRMSELADKADPVQYYARTASILFKYYDILDKGGASAAAATVVHQPSSKSILKWFSVASKGGGSTPQPQAAAAADLAAPPARSLCPAGGKPPIRGGSSASVSLSDDRATLLEKYMMSCDMDGPTRHVLDPNAPAVLPPPVIKPEGVRSSRLDLVDAPSGTQAFSQEACGHCGQRERTVLLQDGLVFCKACHTVEYIIVDHEKPSYKDPPKEVAYFAYKRINHFNEWLSQVQGKETTDIPDEVYDKILLEIKKQKLNNMACLTRKKIKEILKKLKSNKYYEHSAHIIGRINGIPNPHFPPDLEERLRHMFCQIQVPFLKHAPPSRKNFLSYSYCLHKMCQLLDRDEYLDSFALLKSREKLIDQDKIWAKICAELGWTFYPSL